MKLIKIRPLTFFDDLDLNITSRKIINIENLSKTEEKSIKIMDLVAKSMESGIILAKPLSGQPASVTTNIITKDGHIFQFPEPNPVHLYFQNACNHLVTSQNLLKELKEIAPLNYEQQYEKFLIYFNEVTGGIMFLVTSVEAFVNQHISDDYIYEDKKGKKFEKTKIEWLDLKTKIKEIIPAIYCVSFLETNKRDYSHILEVQDLRDELVHLKTEHKNNRTFYEGIIKRLLEFEPEKYVDAVFLYFNSLKPDYIQEDMS